MRRLPRALIHPLIAGVAVIGTAAPALACTPVPGYTVPTNMQLAAEANLILLADVVAGGTPSEGDWEPPGITIRPIAAIKGLMPTGDIRLSGMALAEPGQDMESDPLLFGEAHPSSYMGSCIRYAFPQGRRVLFFLERRDGEWRPAGGPFSRWAEDVEGGDSPWAQLATLYSHAVQLPAEQRIALLEDQHEALQARENDPVARAMAEDVARQMADPELPPPQQPPEFTPEPEEAVAATPEEEVGLDMSPPPEEEETGLDMSPPAAEEPLAPETAAPPPPAEETTPPPEDFDDVEATLDAMGAERRQDASPE